MHSWSFHRLGFYIDYKAKMKGIAVVHVDPRYTSQQCSKCGFRSKSNRRTQSWFCCKRCSYQLNADLNAAKNIRAGFHAGKAISVTGRAVVNKPIVAGPSAASHGF
jgi:putative transposase